MTQTPNGAGNTGRTPERPTPPTGAERVPPVTPPGTAPVPPTAAKPSEPSPTAPGTPGPSAPAADKVHADSARTDGARTTGRTTAPPATASPGSADTGRPAKDGGADKGRPLFAPEEREKFDARIHQAVAGFVENPRQAVQEADATFDEVVAGLTEALATRSRLLRADRDGERSEAGTEDLRIALQQYRDLTERLVRL
ncbi:hypothetical protein RM717_00535 [Streptomyces griseus]|uniref:Secreted protein n=2 Tax=Streptomycetaceae TaxID=2062 RepID=A0ABU2VTR5_9ACTN|nr:hypothetical protein [Streptomyces griseus]ARF70948.1 hypothetical protein B7C62_00780 [Kitasatospora albolonga]MDT0488989.1 hypothetical protein [Streptomyces griseus]